MNIIQAVIVASGVIGRFDHDWHITRVRDYNDDSESYMLYIRNEPILSTKTVAGALLALVNHCNEEN